MSRERELFIEAVRVLPGVIQEAIEGGSPPLLADVADAREVFIEAARFLLAEGELRPGTSEFLKLRLRQEEAATAALLSGAIS